jgi:hypothetical protein
VYISLWKDWCHDAYVDLVVKGGEFDPSEGDASSIDEKYPLQRLRARIMSDWPSN